MIKDIEVDEYEDLINSGNAVLFFFHSYRSFESVLLDRELEFVDDEYGDKLLIARIDLDNNYDFCKGKGAYCAPKMYVYKDKYLMEDEISYLPSERIKYIVKKYLV